MASEDILERAERLLAKCPGYELPPYTDTLIVEDLAAEIRELRAENADLRDQVQVMLDGRRKENQCL